MENQRVVIVVHGFSSHRLWMHPICRRLASKQHLVVNWGYKSLFSPVKRHSARLLQTIQRDFADYDQIDFVAHSMGSVIIRQMLHAHPLPNLGRMVFLTPPSQGAPLARLFSPLVGQVFRCLPDISTSTTSLVNQLPQSSPGPTGVIAARVDLLAPSSKTHIANETCHQTLLATHNSVLFSKQVAEMIHLFLSTGQFSSK